MQICIHRGSKEIGGSCVEVISGGKRLIIDLGLPLDAEFNDKKYLPNISGLDGNDNSLLAILISHPHLDHFGLLAHVNSNIPVIMGVDARRILSVAAPFMNGNWPIPAIGLNLQSGILIELGPFKITPYLIDHSAYDAYSIMVEADGKRLFYSGDLRMHGRKGKLTEKLMAFPPKNIDVLLLEGSTLGRLDDHQTFPSESEIEMKLVDAFKEAPGIVLQNYRVVRFEPKINENDIDKVFLYYLLIAGELLSQIFNKVNSGAQGNIGKVDFEKAIFKKPPFEEQKIISERLISIDHKFQTEQTYLHKLQMIKSGLMGDLLNGKKRVKI